MYKAQYYLILLFEILPFGTSEEKKKTSTQLCTPKKYEWGGQKGKAGSAMS